MDKKKTIGILTVHRSLNYGAVWQCWALGEVCRRLGYEVKTIDFCPWGYWGYAHYLKKRPSKALNYITMQYKFKHFVKKMLNPTAYCESHEEMLDKKDDADILIVGSDQIWSTKIVEEQIGSYLLDFASTGTYRISYAASMGGVLPNEEYQRIFEAELPKFTAIAVREPQFIEKLNEWSGKNVVDVCDPTLLLAREDFLNVSKRKIFLPKKYIAVMNLAEEPFMTEVIKRVQSELSLPIVNLVGTRKKWADYNFIGLSPQEWMFVLANAEFVVTDSFHGTALSIVLRRPFVCCPKKQQLNQEKNIRLTNLLEQTGLAKQLVDDLDSISEKLHVDFLSVNDSIEQYSSRSLQWLEESLNLCK